MTYAAKLRHPKWQKLRLEALGKAGWKCQVCNANDKTLHVHHKTYRSGADPWDYPMKDLEALCESCHLRAHEFLRNRKRFNFDGSYSRADIGRILQCSRKGFLPMKDGHVVCGCFRKPYNPDAPNIILAGDLDYIRHPTEIFSAQAFLFQFSWPLKMNLDEGLRCGTTSVTFT